MNNPVTRPSHYTKGGIETIAYIRAKMSPEEFRGYCRGNILKYISRAPDKNGLEDLKKARVYLDWLIESMEAVKVCDDLTCAAITCAACLGEPYHNSHTYKVGCADYGKEGGQ